VDALKLLLRLGGEIGLETLVDHLLARRAH
jgi:hypothetical protein